MYNIDKSGGGPLMLMYSKFNFIVIGLFLFLLSGCAATNALGERLLKAKGLSEKEKGALVVCTRANALMYGGGNIAIVKTTKSFTGTVEVKKGCGVKIIANPTKQTPSNPAEDLLDTMFNNPSELITE